MTDVKNGDIELEQKDSQNNNFPQSTSVMVNDENIEKQLIEEGKEMAITNLFVDRPFTVLCSGIGVLFLITFISSALGYFDIADQHNREFLVWSDDKVRDWDMLEAAKEAIQAAKSSEGPVAERVQNTPFWNPAILVQGPTGTENLLKKETLLKIKEIEGKLKAQKDWPKYCKATSDTNTTCGPSSFMSPLQYLPANWENKDQKTLNNYWKNFYANKAKFNQLKFLFNSDDQIKKTGEVQYMRILINFGAPLNIDGKKYNDITDNYLDQRLQVNNFQAEWVKIIDKFKEDNGKEVQIDIFSEAVAQIEFGKLLQKDTAFAAFSIMFVMAYFVFHLKSFFLAGIGVLLILLSFGFTALIHQGIFRVQFYSNLHNLIIFIVLGIAADDIFVFIDAWRQSACIDIFKGDRKMRMSYAWKRAVRAIAVTSSTTAVAFLSNTLSPMMPIQSFGIYAAIIIPANYLLIIMIFPAAVIIYEDKLEIYKCCCCCKRTKLEQEDQEEVPQTERDVAEGGQDENPQTERNVAEGGQDENLKQESKIDIFFAGTWNTNVHKFRWVIIVVFLIWSIFAAIMAFQIGPLSKEEEFLPSDHPIQVMIQSLQTKFDGGGNQDMKIDLFWGIKDLNTDGGSHWDPQFIGKAIMDDKFDLSPKEAQKSLMDFCIDLRKQDFVQNQKVLCWIEGFDKYVQLKYRTKINSGGYRINKRLPLPPAEFNKELQAYRKTPVGKQLESDFTIGFFKEKLQFTQIYSESVGDRRAAYAEKYPIYKKWQDYMEAYTKSAPPTLQSGIQTAGVFWGWMQSERAFLTSAVNGMACAIAFSFLILLIATQNIILALLAIISVAVVILSVVGIMVMKGWELGVSESISVVIMIGLSVDYVVHLAADYKHSQHPTRFLKIQQAYREMGVSIMSGTITTLGCGCALFGGVLVTFQKFAVVISCTIFISFLAAMLLFGALCHVMGPEGEQGNIFYFCQKKKEENTEQQKEHTIQIE